MAVRGIDFALVGHRGRQQHDASAICGGENRAWLDFDIAGHAGAAFEHGWECIPDCAYVACEQSAEIGRILDIESRSYQSADVNLGAICKDHSILVDQVNLPDGFQLPRNDAGVLAPNMVER